MYSLIFGENVFYVLVSLVVELVVTVVAVVDVVDRLVGCSIFK